MMQDARDYIEKFFMEDVVKENGQLLWVSMGQIRVFGFDQVIGFATDRELMKAAFKGGEIRHVLYITNESFVGCEVFKSVIGVWAFGMAAK